MDGNPFFSVIVPIYLVEPYLDQCVRSILGQSFGDFELILVDDCSPDGCPGMCDGYAAEDSRVRVIHKEENGGLVRARETGLLASRGDYICWVDGDDFAATDMLERLYAVLEEYGRIDAVCFDHLALFDGDVPRVERWNVNGYVQGFYNKARSERELYPYMLRDPRRGFGMSLIYGTVWSKCFRRELVLEHRCVDYGLTVGEDMAFVYECLWFADGIYCLDAPLYYYRQRPGSMIHSAGDTKVDQIQRTARYIRSRFGSFSVRCSEQVENWYVGWIIQAVFGFRRRHVPFAKACRDIDEVMRRTGALDDIVVGKQVPFPIRVAVWMLRHHMYWFVLAVADVWILLDGLRNALDRARIRRKEACRG